jgi:hypothetical protein
LGITQSIANIQATYEQALIAAHEAELVAFRAELETRLAKAHEILREVGLE